MANSNSTRGRTPSLLRLIGPGIILAATGVGAGDLAAASLAGANVGLVVLWAVLLGAFFKFVLNEGLTRWQLATGTTLVEGAARHLGAAVRWVFLLYLFVWSFLVAAALMSAIGVTSHAMWPLFGSDDEAARTDKIVYGVAHSLAAVLLIQLGGYRLFEKLMSACVAVMFVGVVVTAISLGPPWGEVLRGIFVPRLPTDVAGGVSWTVALIGGVGGTVTILCYGYWIREEGRRGMGELTTCRIDLVNGYVMTALFGLSMVVIGHSLGTVEGGGARLMIQIASKLQDTMGAIGPVAKWAFLAGAWAAIFTSLFGVWQSVPYLFADLWQLRMGRVKLQEAGSGKVDANSLGHFEDPSPDPSPQRGGEFGYVDTNRWPYQMYLYGIALVPIVGLVAVEFATMQKVNAVVGALFIPMLAAVLLVLNGQARWVGAANKNSWATTVVLVGALLFFLYAGWLEVYAALF